MPANRPETGIESVLYFEVGDQTIKAVIYQKGQYAKELYFNMHDDENTSVQAARRIIDIYGGKLVELKHSGRREVSFNLNGKMYHFDPNRIFTKKGIEASLKKYGSYSHEALEEVWSFSQELVKKVVKDAKIVVALHNNVNTIYFSVASYAQGGNFSREASNVYINPQMGRGDFFYVTTSNFFEHFKKTKFSVVLQNNSNVTDDGSLSVYCGQNKIPYINVEAEHGHLEEQVAMLTELQKLLPSYQKYLAIQEELARQREMQRRLEEQKAYQEFRQAIEIQFKLQAEMQEKLKSLKQERNIRKSKTELYDYQNIIKNKKLQKLDIYYTKGRKGKKDWIGYNIR